MAKTYDVKVKRDDGSESRFKVECQLNPGNPHGYFDPMTGDGEPPSGPEIDVTKMELVTEAGLVAFDIDTLSEQEWDALTEAVADADNVLVEKAMVAAESRAAEIENDRREGEDNADLWENEYPERMDDA